MGGEVCEEEQEEISEFFQNLLMTSNPCDRNEILGGLQRKVIDSMNTKLTSRNQSSSILYEP